MTVIDDYIKNFDPSKKQELERIRKIALEVVPDAQEVISYAMPALTYKGKAFLGFNATALFKYQVERGRSFLKRPYRLPSV